MIGTSDQSCWLAEACKSLLLLLLRAGPGRNAHGGVNVEAMQSETLTVMKSCACNCSTLYNLYFENASYEAQHAYVAGKLQSDSPDTYYGIFADAIDLDIVLTSTCKYYS